MSDKQNPFELFDGEWFKDATSQLCADGWPAFIVPLNIGIRKIRESHQELKSALESANAELEAAKAEIAKLKYDLKMSIEIGVEMQREVNRKLSVENNRVESENARLREALKETKDCMMDFIARGNESIETVCANEDCDFQCYGCIKTMSDCDYMVDRIKSVLARNPAKPGEGESL